MKSELIEISQTECKIVISFEIEEVNAAIDMCIADYAKDLKIDGYRKGKAPLDLIAHTFQKEIITKTTDYIINNTFEDVTKFLNLRPISRVHFSAEELGRDKAYGFSANFEILPKINLPTNLEDIQVKVLEPLPPKEEQKQITDTLLRKYARLEQVLEKRNPQDGDIVVIDVEGKYKDKLVPQMSANNFKLFLGHDDAQEVSAIVKSLKIDEDGCGSMICPENFPDKELCGKKIDIKVKLKALFKQILPEINDDFAKKIGFKDFKNMNNFIFHQAMSMQLVKNKIETEKKLLDIILPKEDFELPKTMLNADITELKMQTKYSLLKQGMQIKEIEKILFEQKDDLEIKARQITKERAFFLAIALKYNLVVSPKNIENYIAELAKKSEQEYQTLYDKMIASDIQYELEDRILAQKAKEYLYTNVKKIVVDSNGNVVAIPEYKTD